MKAKNKIIVAVLTLFILSAIAITAFAVFRGDLTGDGKSDTKDVTRIIKALAGIEAIPVEYGELSMQDAKDMQQYYLYGTKPVRFFVDGKETVMMPGAYEIDGVTFAPLDELTQILQLNLTDKPNGFELKRSLVTVQFTLNSADVQIENLLDNAQTGNEGYINRTLEAAAVMSDGGRIYAPVKDIAEMFRYTYRFNSGFNQMTVSTKENGDWWNDYPTQSDRTTYSDTLKVGSVQGFTGDYGWGRVFNQDVQFGNQNDVTTFRLKDKKLLSYVSNGSYSTVAIGYDKTIAEGLPDRFKYHGWVFNDWNQWGDTKYITYSGLHNDVNDEEVLLAAGYTRETLGYSEPKYSNGTSAMGFFSPTEERPYPLNAKVYDMASAKNINGYISFTDVTLLFDKSMYYNTFKDQYGDMFMKIKVGTGLLPTLSGYTAGSFASPMRVDMAKDVASPFWLEHAKVIGEMFGRYYVDGSWFDNVSPWFNFFGMHNAFGDWSESTFKTYLADNFTQTQLINMGISNASTFDIRQYMANKLISTAENNVNWISDPVWSAYKVHKSKVGSNFVKNSYMLVKTEVGKSRNNDPQFEGFMYSGNDFPAINHGWIEDEWMDVCATEMSFGWNLAFGTRGLMPPPYGRIDVWFKLATECQSGLYAIPWTYTNAASYLTGNNGTNIHNKTNAGKTVLAAAFANNAFIMQAHETAGTAESHIWLNTFVEQEKENLGTRYPIADIAIVYSTQDQLGNMTPNSATGPDMDYALHGIGMLGWGHMFTDKHVPYRYLPTWKINEQTLKGIKVLIMPNMEFVDDWLVDVVNDYLNNGGQVIMTGPVAKRHGPDGNFALRTGRLPFEMTGSTYMNSSPTSVTAYTNATSTTSSTYTQRTRTYENGGKITFMQAPIGWQYFQAGISTGIGVGKFSGRFRPAIAGTATATSTNNTMMGMLPSGADKTLFDGSLLPISVACNLLASADGNTIFVDFVNYNLNASDANDIVTPLTNLKFSVKLPAWSSGYSPKATVITPDGANYTLTQDSVTNGVATYTLPTLNVYSTVKIEKN